VATLCARTNRRHSTDASNGFMDPAALGKCAAAAHAKGWNGGAMTWQYVCSPPRVCALPDRCARFPNAKSAWAQTVRGTAFPLGGGGGTAPTSDQPAPTGSGSILPTSTRSHHSASLLPKPTLGHHSTSSPASDMPDPTDLPGPTNSDDSILPKPTSTKSESILRKPPGWFTNTNTNLPEPTSSKHASILRKPSGGHNTNTDLPEPTSTKSESILRKPPGGSKTVSHHSSAHGAKSTQKPTGQCPAAWSATKAYTKGSEVTFAAKKYRAKWDTTGAKPDGSQTCEDGTKTCHPWILDSIC
jgi:hypothetical protein